MSFFLNIGERAEQFMQHAAERAVHMFNRFAEEAGIPIRLRYRNGRIEVEDWHHHLHHWHHWHMHHRPRPYFHRHLTMWNNERNMPETEQPLNRARTGSRGEAGRRRMREEHVPAPVPEQRREEEREASISAAEETGKAEPSIEMMAKERGSSSLSPSRRAVLKQLLEDVNKALEKNPMPSRGVVKKLLELELLLEASPEEERSFLFHGIGFGRFLHHLFMYASGMERGDELEKMIEMIRHRLDHLEELERRIGKSMGAQAQKHGESTGLEYWVKQLENYYAEAIKEVENNKPIGIVLDKFIKEFEQLIEQAPPEYYPILRTYFKHMIRKLYRWYLYLAGILRA